MKLISLFLSLIFAVSVNAAPPAITDPDGTETFSSSSHNAVISVSDINKQSSSGSFATDDIIGKIDTDSGNVYGIPVINGMLDSSDVGFIQGGTGAVERPVAEKLEDIVSIKDFGASGDGSTETTTTSGAGTGITVAAFATFKVGHGVNVNDSGTITAVASCGATVVGDDCTSVNWVLADAIADCSGGCAVQHDDTAATQAATDTGVDIYTPQGRYLLSSTVTGTVRGQAFYGNAGGIAGKEDITATDAGSIFQFNIPDGAAADTMFEMTLSQVSFSFLKFVGDLGNTDDIAITFKKNDLNTDDMDGYVIDCGFYRWDIGSHFFGRALRANSNLFSNTVIGFILDWPADGTDGSEIQTDDRYKGRGHRFTDNRFHGGTGFVVQNYVQRGAVYSINQLDIGNRLLLVTGGTDSGLDGAVIDGNIVDMCSLDSIKFEEGTTCNDVVISNNRLGGTIADTVVGTGDKRPFSAIKFDSISEIDGLTITGNIIKGTDAHAITLQNDQAAPAITATNIVITNNDFSDTGATGADRAMFNSIYDVTGFDFSHNVIKDVGASVTRIVSTTGTLTNPIIRANTYDSSLDLVFGTMAGRKSVEEQQGVFSVGNSGQFLLGDQGAYSSIMPLVLSRTTSSGGVGTQYTNSAGYVRLFGVATGVGTGSFTTETTNQVDIGTDSIRWKDGFLSGDLFIGGSLQAKVLRVTKNTTDSLSILEMSNTAVDNVGQSATSVITAVALTGEERFCFDMSTAGFSINFNTTGQTLTLDGVDASGGISNDGSTAGDEFCCKGARDTGGTVYMKCKTEQGAGWVI